MSIQQRREDAENMLAQVVVGQIQQYLLERTPLVLDAEIVTAVRHTPMGGVLLTLESGRIVSANIIIASLALGQTEEQQCDECKSPNVSTDPITRSTVHRMYHVVR